MDIPTSIVLAWATIVAATILVLLLWNVVVPAKWKFEKQAPFVNYHPDDPEARRALYRWGACCVVGIVAIVLLAKFYRHLFLVLTALVPAAWSRS